MAQTAAIAVTLFVVVIIIVGMVIFRRARKGPSHDEPAATTSPMDFATDETPVGISRPPGEHPPSHGPTGRPPFVPEVPPTHPALSPGHDMTGVTAGTHPAGPTTTLPAPTTPASVISNGMRHPRSLEPSEPATSRHVPSSPPVPLPLEPKSNLEPASTGGVVDPCTHLFQHHLETECDKNEVARQRWGERYRRCIAAQGRSRKDHCRSFKQWYPGRKNHGYGDGHPGSHPAVSGGVQAPRTPSAPGYTLVRMCNQLNRLTGPSIADRHCVQVGETLTCDEYVACLTRYDALPCTDFGIIDPWSNRCHTRPLAGKPIDETRRRRTDREEDEDEEDEAEEEAAEGDD